MNQKKVSVIMPCYNSAKYLSAAIESILRQTYRNWELIVVDNGSEDTSADIIKEYVNNDSRIKMLTIQKNNGPGPARNLAIQYSTGEYVALLDADDIAKNKRIQSQVQFLERNPKYGAVGGQACLLNSQSQVTGVAKRPTSWMDIKTKMLFKDPFINSSMMVRKKILDRYHIAFNDKFAYAEDYMFWVEISRYCKICNLAETVVYYRDHGTGLWHEWENFMQSGNSCCKYHQMIYYSLWARNNINMSAIDKDALINTLTGKQIKSMREAFVNIKSIIKYGWSISNGTYNRIVFLEVLECLKRTGYMVLHLLKPIEKYF